MILLIDNYDSFTYNLYQYLCELGADVRVVRNDAATVDEIIAMKPEKVVLSPGPRTPDEAGVCVPLVHALAGKVPLLGVCLGHQAIGQAFGGEVVRAPSLMHGKVSAVHHNGEGVFAGLPSPFTAIRYHSLVVERAGLPDVFEITAETADGLVMGVRHRDYPDVQGVQFHPESILTEHGKDLLKNFLDGQPANDVGAVREPPSPASTEPKRDTEARREGGSRTAPTPTPAPAPVGIKAAIARVVEGHTLSQEEAAAAMDAIMVGEATESQIAALVTALRLRGETEAEIAGFAQTMRRHARRVALDDLPVVDTCGTGGDGSGSFNISTTAAFVVAGAGVPVAKHGNRAMTSRCGSADVLEGLGAYIERTPEQVAQCVRTVGFGFMFAPNFHPAMRYAGPVRRDIGVRTVFNLLGPLTNPAGAERQVLGVGDALLATKLAHVLALLGTKHALVVHGQEGLDEVSLAGPTVVHEVRGDDVTTYTITPEQFGLARALPSATAGGSVDENVAITRRILAGERGPHRDVTLLNAAAALVAADAVPNFAAGIALAAGSIDSGRAQGAMERFVALTKLMHEAAQRGEWAKVS